MVHKRKNFKLYPFIFSIVLIFFYNNSSAQVKETNYFCTEDFSKNYTLEKFQLKLSEGVNVNEKCKWTEMPALFSIFNTIKDTKALELLGQTNADFGYIEKNLKYSRGRNLLFSAVRGYLTESIPFLINKGVDINKRDYMGNTPLLRACLSSENNKMIDELIKNGANINDVNLNGENCLSNSFSFNKNHNQIKKIFYQIKTKERPFCKEGNSPNELKKITCPTLLIEYLHRGVSAQIDVNFVEFLIKSGFDPNEYSHEVYGYDRRERITPLIQILSHKYINIDDKIKLTKSLLRLGADPNKGNENGYMYEKVKYGHTPIFYAIDIRNVKSFEKHKELLKVLISFGADLNISVNYGYRRIPLWKTLTIKPLSRFKKMTTFLWANGADINKRNASGRTLIFDVIGEKNEFEMLKHLFSLGAKINLSDMSGFYLAHRIAQSSFTPKLIDFLISKGMSFKIKGKNNMTPLMSASLNNPHYDIIKKILNLDVNVNARTKYKHTSLMFAAMQNKNPLIVKELISKGSDVNAKTINGISPIMFAAYNGDIAFDKKEKKISVQLVKMLLEAGANINNVSNDGSNVLHTAVSSNVTPYLTLFLIENGVNYRQKNSKGKTALDLIKKNNYLKNSDAYWKLHQLNIE